MISQTLGSGMRGGILGLLGNAVGIALHALLAAVGVAQLMTHQPGWRTALTVAGALFLIYLGVMAFRSDGKGLIPDAAAGEPRAGWFIFRDGVLMAALNPKIVALLLAVLPRFVRAESGGEVSLSETFWQSMLLGAVHVSIASTILLLVSLLSDRLAPRLERSAGLRNALRLVTGSFLILFGVLMIATG